MALPDNFLFSQGNLQDYIDCKKRFKLRYLWQLSWPAITSEPVSEYEKLLRKGQSFHHIIHQHLVGIPIKKLEAMVNHLDLSEWWENYLVFYHENIDAKANSLPEITYLYEVDQFRIMARYDLLLVKGNEIRIIDWKTSHLLPKRHDLEKRMQSRIYPFLLTNVGNHLIPGGEIKPERIEMVYWYPQFPEQPVILPYSQLQYEDDENFLNRLIKEIASLGEGDYTETEDVNQCRYCVFRSFCDRGSQPGEFSAINDSSMDSHDQFSYDFEAIPEIELNTGLIHHELD